MFSEGARTSGGGDFWLLLILNTVKSSLELPAHQLFRITAPFLFTAYETHQYLVHLPHITMIIRLNSFFLAATTVSVFFLGGVTAIESKADQWKFDLESANMLMSQGKYSDAIALYDTVIRTPPPFDVF